MKCPDFEKLIALQAEDDLPQRKGALVAEHLKSCQNCQEFAEKLRASQAMLKSLAQESVDETILEQVRQRVLDGLRAETQPLPLSLRQYALGAGLLATMVVLAIAFWRPSHRVAPSVAHLVPKESAPKHMNHVPKPVPPRPVRTAKRKHASPLRPHSQTSLPASMKPQQPAQLLVKLVTDNPNVVIYWLVD